MSDFKKFETIENTDNLGVVSLAIRPNQASKFGEGNLSGKDLQRRFDRLANAIVKEYNNLVKIFGNAFAEDENGNPLDRALSYIAWRVKTNSLTGEKHTESLADFMDYLKNGTFANEILYVSNPTVVSDDGEESELDTLNSVLETLYAKITALFGRVQESLSALEEFTGFDEKVDSIPETYYTKCEQRLWAEELSSTIGKTAADTAEDLNTHKTDPEAHNDIRLQLQDFVAKVKALHDADDETLDQTIEVIALIKSNKSLIDAILTNKDIINNLTDLSKNIPSNLKNGATAGSLYQINARLITDPNNKGGTTEAPNQLEPYDSVALGTSVVCGDKAFACGKNTLAYKNGAFAEGEGKIVYLDDAKTKIDTEKSTGALGWYCHTEGRMTKATATATHTEGIGTIAASACQHVQGKYNIEDPNNTYAHIVGNGIEDRPSNAHTIDWAGNGWFAANVFVGGTGQDDEGAVDRLATLSELLDLKTKLDTIDWGANCYNLLDSGNFKDIITIEKNYLSREGDDYSKRLITKEEADKLAGIEEGATAGGYDNATQQSAGLMSAEDKINLDFLNDYSRCIIDEIVNHLNIEFTETHSLLGYSSSTHVGKQQFPYSISVSVPVWRDVICYSAEIQGENNVASQIITFDETTSKITISGNAVAQYAPIKFNLTYSYKLKSLT